MTRSTRGLSATAELVVIFYAVFHTPVSFNDLARGLRYRSNLPYDI